MDNLKLTFDQGKNKAVIARFAGEFAGEDVLQVQSTLVDMLRQQIEGDFSLDFKDVLYIDSAGIGLIFELAQVALERGTRFAIINTSSAVKKVLKVTRVDELVKVS